MDPRFEDQRWDSGLIEVNGEVNEGHMKFGGQESQSTKCLGKDMKIYEHMAVCQNLVPLLFTSK